MPVTPITDNPYAKKIHDLKHMLYGTSLTPYGHEHEALTTALAEALEVIESLSVLTVNTSQQIKNLKLWGDQVMLDPSNPKDIQHAIYEMRDQIEVLTKWTASVEKSAADNRKWTIIDACMAKAAGRKVDPTDIWEPNHFQKIVHPFASLGNSIIAAHRRAGKNVYCFREAANFALLNPDSRTMVFTARPHEDQDLRPFFPTIEVFDTITTKPCRYKLKNGAVIDVVNAYRMSKGSVCGTAADRLFITEASLIDWETLKAIEPIMHGTVGHHCLSTILWTPMRSYETQAHIIEKFWNSPAYAQLRYPVTNNPEYTGKAEEIRSQFSWEEYRFEWMAEVPEKPKHTCKCKEGCK